MEKWVIFNMVFNIACSITMVGLFSNSGSLGKSSFGRPNILKKHFPHFMAIELFFRVLIKMSSSGNSLMISLNLLAGTVIAPSSSTSDEKTEHIPISRFVLVSFILFASASISTFERMGRLTLDEITFWTYWIFSTRSFFNIFSFIDILMKVNTLFFYYTLKIN